MLIPSTKAGFLGKTYGTDGYIKVHLEEGMDQYIDQSEHLFLNQHGQFVPYRIIGRDDASHILVKLYGHETKETAQDLVGLEVYLDEWNLDIEERQADSNPLIGLSISDGTNIVGQIAELEDMPTQVLAKVVDSKGKVLMIPIIEDWISNIDPELGIITMNLPEGILDLD